MQLVSCVFWLLLFVYFEQIMPQAHGPAHQDHPLFCFGCKSSDKKKKKSTASATVDSEVGEVGEGGDGKDKEVEMTATNGATETATRSNFGISVRDLVMEFTVSAETATKAAEVQQKKKKKGLNDDDAAGVAGETISTTETKSKTLRAVDGLTVEFAGGTITAVLGHNGAGKTTAIRCMTGSLMPTSGSVYVNGRNVLSGGANTEWLKKNVGVCPQHDVLYDELSAREHVVLFGAMRGLDVTTTQIKGEEQDLVKECLSGVDMLGKAGELVSTFSGGQKRRLSVALALLGAPPVVILDEPTTGMDVITRQSVWKSIQRLKNKATIILTTHAMEEADALGDHIVVMSHGRVQAQGTSLDLKQRFGVGFHLHVVTQERRGEKRMQLEDEPTEAKNVEEREEQEEKEKEEEMITMPFNADTLVETLRKHVSEGDKVKVLTNVGTECSLTLPAETNMFPALFTELEERREELGINQVALSMTTLEEVFLELVKLEDDEEKEEEEDKNLVTVDVMEEAAAEVEAALGGSWSQQVRGVSLLNVYSKKREPMTTCAICIQPIMFVCIAGIIHLATGGTNFVADPVVPFETNDPLPPNALAWGSANLTTSSPLATNLTAQIPQSNNANGVISPAQYLFEYNVGSDMVDALTNGIIGQGQRNGPKYVEYAIEIEQPWSWTPAPYTRPPTMITMFTSDISRSLREMFAAVQTAETLARSSKEAALSQHLLSVPTYQQLPKGTTAVVNSAEWKSGGIMILAALPIAFMSAFYGERLVRDRVGGMRVHLFVSSLRRTQYYVGNFLVDFMLYLPVAILTPILLLCFQFPGVLKTNLWAFFWIFLLFGPVVIGFGYLLSWLFSSVQTAQEWFGELINITMAIPFLITTFVILDATELGHSICGVIPGYAIYRGMGVIEGEAKGGQPYLTWSDIFSSNRSLLWVLVVMIIDIILYWSIIILVELLEARCGACHDAMTLRCTGKGTEDVLGGGGSNDDARTIRAPDPRVLEEIALVKTMTTANTTSVCDMRDAKNEERKIGLVIDNMSKTFVMSDGRLNKAVRDVCLTVDKGTVFGLLGMNGAGKTTLLHAIQGKHQVTSGDCYVDAGGAVGADGADGTPPLSCRNDVDRVRQLFGICPQHEVLWEYVTPREHLRAFAHIRGVPSEKIEDMVENLLKRLDLLPKAEEQSGKLSGGMKRRLSIAMSVIGSPKCVFLDEPTTGLDPNTRRFVWDYILEIKKGRIIILTTHSMEEADALCTNIGACLFDFILSFVLSLSFLSLLISQVSLLTLFSSFSFLLFSISLQSHVSHL